MICPFRSDGARMIDNYPDCEQNMHARFMMSGPGPSVLTRPAGLFKPICDDQLSTGTVPHGHHATKAASIRGKHSTNSTPVRWAAYLPERLWAGPGISDPWKDHPLPLPGSLWWSSITGAIIDLIAEVITMIAPLFSACFPQSPLTSLPMSWAPVPCRCTPKPLGAVCHALNPSTWPTFGSVCTCRKTAFLSWSGATRRDGLASAPATTTITPSMPPAIKMMLTRLGWWIISSGWFKKQIYKIIFEGILFSPDIFHIDMIALMTIILSRGSDMNTAIVAKTNRKTSTSTRKYFLS